MTEPFMTAREVEKQSGGNRNPCRALIKRERLGISAGVLRVNGGEKGFAREHEIFIRIRGRNRC
jgi:hypothetical protein